MKVWEKFNELKGASETKEEIAEWAYFNRICPLMFDCCFYEPAEDGYPPENGFLKTAREICENQGKCGMGCLTAYLDSEFIEVGDD